MRSAWLKTLRADILASLEAETSPSGAIFLRRANDRDALYVTNAPRLLHSADAVHARLLEQGFRVTERNGLWFLDPPFSWLKREISPEALPCTACEGAHARGSLYRLISMHGADCEDGFSMRILIKAMEVDDPSAVHSIAAIQAERLRKGTGLSKWLLPWLAEWIRRSENHADTVL